jgi:DNA-3-methyladenine glycosylase II
MKITKKQIDFLKEKDPILGKILVGKIKRNFEKRTVYESLLSSIISQQISLSAAASIKKRFLELFSGYPNFSQLIKAQEEKLRNCGLSKQKINYLKNVAIHFQEETLSDEKFHKMSDQEIIDDLTKIKGVGKWTVEMLLIFTLNRSNIFSTKDIGLINPVCELYKINRKKTKPKNLEKKLLKISSLWDPYKTVASLYLWQYKDGK